MRSATNSSREPSENPGFMRSHGDTTWKQKRAPASQVLMESGRIAVQARLILQNVLIMDLAGSLIRGQTPRAPRSNR